MNIKRKRVINMLNTIDLLKLIKPWYLWLPIVDIVLTLILKCLYNLKTFDQFFEPRNILALMLLIISTLVKSYSIVRYANYVQGVNEKAKLGEGVFYFLPSLFFLLSFYVNFPTPKIILIALLEVMMYFLSNWLRQFKVHAHVVADSLTVIFFIVAFYFDWKFPSDLIAFVIVGVFMMMRYLVVSILSTGIRRSTWGNLWYIGNRVYLFAETFSFLLFLGTFVSALQILSEGFFLVKTVAISFIYYVFLYLRLLCYKLYSLEPKDIKSLRMALPLLGIYLIVVNLLDIDVIIWFSPLFLVEILSNITLLTKSQVKKEEARLTHKTKQLFAWLKLNVFISILTLQLIKMNYRKSHTAWFSYLLFDFYDKNDSNQFLVEIILIPVLAISIGVAFTALLTWINEKYILTKKNLFVHPNIQTKRYRKRLRK